MQRNVEPSATFFQAFNSVIRSFTSSSSQCLCFEAPTALSFSLMLSFFTSQPVSQSARINRMISPSDANDLGRPCNSLFEIQMFHRYVFIVA